MSGNKAESCGLSAEDVDTRQRVINLVNEFFQSEAKTAEWMRAQNPLLGGFSPDQMVLLGGADKLLRFVEESAGVQLTTEEGER